MHLHMASQPWHDETLLRKMYHDDDMIQSEIADEFGCSRTTITKWMDEHGIEARDKSEAATRHWSEKDYPWKDKERLEELYLDKRMSTTQIADEMDCSRSTIGEWLDKYGIPRRSQGEEIEINAMQNPNICFYMDHGYERIVDHCGGGRDTCYVHRLLAVAEYGFDAVKNSDVHHKNEIKWDNRPENIELMDISEHRRYHMEQRIEQGEHPA